MFNDVQSIAGSSDSSGSSSPEHAVTIVIDLEKAKILRKKQTEFEEAVHEPPEEVGFDAPAWTPTLVQQYFDETSDGKFLVSSCQRLLKKAAGSGRHSSVYGQTKKSVKVDPRTAWFPVVRGYLSNYQDNVTGRVFWADHRRGDRFSLDLKSTLPPITRNISFSEYVPNSKIPRSRFWTESRTFRRQPSWIQPPVTTLRSHVTSISPELNPVEERWRQLQATLRNRFFDSLAELPTATETALTQLSIPEMRNHF